MKHLQNVTHQIVLMHSAITTIKSQCYFRAEDKHNRHSDCSGVMKEVMKAMVFGADAEF